jgi:hypothetical protein
MKDQPNPVGTDQTEMAAKASGRRRLVRGAVALAPVVLTLRSGALAAASCTGARLVDIPNNGKFKPASTTEYCIDDSVPNVCPTYSTGVGRTKVVTDKNAKLVNVTSAGDDDFYCGTANDHLKDRRVAILSSLSATSFRLP